MDKTGVVPALLEPMITLRKRQRSILMAVFFQRWNCWVVWVWVWICMDLPVHSVSTPGQYRESPERQVHSLSPLPLWALNPGWAPISAAFLSQTRSGVLPLQRRMRRLLNSGSLQFWVLQRPWSLWQWVLRGDISWTERLSIGVLGIPETSSWRSPSFFL